MSMSIDKVIEILESRKAPETEQDFDDFDAAIEMAIKLLKTYPKNQPNDPLTPGQLREMDGEPVWNDTTKRWAIVDTHSRTTTNVNGCWRPFSDRYYRCKPEEERHETNPI